MSNDDVTFEESDWRDLSPSDKRALRIFSRVSLDFEALVKASGVAQKGMDNLISKGLAIEGTPSTDGRTFKLTDKGWLAVEWLSGRRTRTFKPHS
jgi:predicted transcriptional regulator